MKIIVSAFSNLSTDQRIEKVCETLHKNGYTIELIGNSWGGMQKMERPYEFSRIELKSQSLKFAYPEFNYKLYQKLKKAANKQTILLANDLDALLPNYWIAKKNNSSLVFDSHEIFTEMPSLQGRSVKKIWKNLEQRLVPKIKLMMTESESYADWFHREYGVQPIVVRNIPRKLVQPTSFPKNSPKIMIYQGAINQSRGLPQAIKAMHFLENTIFKIAGDGPKRNELEQLVKNEKLEDKVQFIGKLFPEDLRKFTVTADVGISLEENGGVSYLYSLPNKVSDYIQARVPLVMINFPEMQRVKNQFDVGEMIDNHEPKTIAEAIKKVLNNGRDYYLPALNKAAEVLCWENEEEKILTLFEEAKKQIN